MLYISIVVLLLLSAFFSASETSLSTLNRIRLRKNAQGGDPRAKAALGLVEQYDKTLTTILVGNNIVNIATSTIAALIFTSRFRTYGALISTVVCTVLVLTFGEIMPKSLANANSDSVALKVAQPLRTVSIVLAPFSFLFGKLQKALRVKGATVEKAPSITEEELLYFIESIGEEGVLEEQESNLVQSALEFDETTLREIITPRVNLAALDADSSPEEITSFLLEVNHSRVPVYENSVDNIIGILFVRDALRRLLGAGEFNLRELLEEPYYVHKGMTLSALLSVFQSQKVRMAIVLDEYGGTLGIVTPIDLLEELVGDFYDDEEPDSLTALENGSFEIAGGCDLWDMFARLGIDEAEVDSDYSTVSGWIMSHIGSIPEAGEGFDFKGYRFTVLEMDVNRVGRLVAEPV